MNTSRRQFLGSSALISLAPLAPQLWVQASSRAAEKPGERILVVVQLSGGNDGLNTVIPYADDNYRKNRFTLAIPKEQVLKIDNHVGFHPSLRGFSKLLENGQLAIVQGVGYPQPNRSHFESMDLWHTAHQLSGSRPQGWLGRFLDAAVAGLGGDVPALHLGAEKQPLALVGLKVTAPSVQSLDRFRLEPKDPQFNSLVRKLSQGERPGGGDLLNFVQQSSTAALASSQRVEEALGKYKTEVSFPTTGLGQKLRSVAQLIDAGLSTRIYYVTLDGFDTHSNQGAAHAGLLTELGDAMSAFLEDIGQHGHGRRVAVLAFSEFGRRVKENASQGTDHGAAAPIFIAGNVAKAGLIGRHPSLTDLDDGDLKHHTDYRQLYATLLDSWLGLASEPILGGTYSRLPVFAS